MTYLSESDTNGQKQTQVDKKHTNDGQKQTETNKKDINGQG